MKKLKLHFYIQTFMRLMSLKVAHGNLRTELSEWKLDISLPLEITVSQINISISLLD